MPFSPLLSHFNLQYYRLYWIVPAMIGIAWLHHRRKVTAMDAVLLFYLYCMATTGMSPQYMLWPLPLLLVTRRLRLAALYTAVATAFLLIFYSNPWASYFAFENMGVFAPIRTLSWLLPPAALETRRALGILHGIGNLAFPACAIIVAFFVVHSRRRQMAYERSRVDESDWHWNLAKWYLATPFLLFAAILVCRLTVNTSDLHFRLTRIWNAVPGAYGLRIQWSDPKILVFRDSAAFTPLNIVVLLAVFAATWCVLAARAQSTACATQ